MKTNVYHLNDYKTLSLNLRLSGDTLDLSISTSSDKRELILKDIESELLSDDQYKEILNLIPERLNLYRSRS